MRGLWLQRKQAADKLEGGICLRRASDSHASSGSTRLLSGQARGGPANQATALNAEAGWDGREGCNRSGSLVAITNS